MLACPHMWCYQCELGAAAAVLLQNGADMIINNKFDPSCRDLVSSLYCLPNADPFTICVVSSCVVPAAHFALILPANPAIQDVLRKL